jgi:hypothetical protein
MDTCVAHREHVTRGTLCRAGYDIALLSMAIAHRYRIEWQRVFPFAGWFLDHQLIEPTWNPEAKTLKKMEGVIAAEMKAAEQAGQ